MAPRATKDVIVDIEDGTVVRYTMRSLTEEEIGPWAEFCASCFAYKANPPPASYFERHFYNDPDRDPSLIRVMFHNGTTMVSSVRIVRRRISSGSAETWDAGGIGDVCTDGKHRHRGLSKLLLEGAIQVMTSEQMQLSLLHAAPAFFPVYQKRGYESVTSHWSVVEVDVTKCLKLEQQPATTIRLAQFPADTERLQALHQDYSESRFAGSIVRSDTSYWNNYLSGELDGSVWVLVQSNQLVAWLSIRQRGGRYQLREFGCDRQLIAAAVAMSLLLQKALVDQENVDLHLPTPVLDDVRKDKGEISASFVNWTTEKADDDDGWMYKTLGNTELMSQTRSHLIWPADSF